MQLTKNFNKSEFECKDGSLMPVEVLENVETLAIQLQYIRDSLNGRPMRITNAYRSPEHNKKVGGTKNSQHLYGNAADIQIKNMTPKAVYKILNKLMNRGEILQGGLGLYKSFVHYDIRGNKARWDYSNK